MGTTEKRVIDNQETGKPLKRKRLRPKHDAPNVNSSVDCLSNPQTPISLDNSQANASPTIQGNPTSSDIQAVASRPLDTERWSYTTAGGQRRCLSPKQQIVLQAMMAGMPGNQAIMGTPGYNQASKSASVTASRLLATANQHGIIAQELELAGIGRAVQIGRLADVVSGRYHWTTEHRAVNADGTPGRKQIITMQPTARDVVTAIATADRISGAKEARRVQADVLSAEMRLLLRKHSPASGLRDVSGSAEISPTRPRPGPVADYRDEGIDSQADDVQDSVDASKADSIQPSADDGMVDTLEHERAWAGGQTRGEGGNGCGV